MSHIDFEKMKVHLIFVLIVLLILGGTFVLFTYDSYLEARTFCKLTGRTDVTWWDAMWVELRVSE